MVSSRKVWLIALYGLFAGLPACSTQRGSAPPARRRVRSAYRLRVEALGSDRKESLRALEMPQKEVHKRLGAFSLRLRSKQRVSLPGQKLRQLDQDVTLSVDAKGQYQLVKNTHPQYGREVRFVSGKLYPRLRYGQFLARAPRSPEEAWEIAERGAGLLGAYARLLGRFTDLQQKGRAERAGRPVLTLELSRRAKPLALAGELPRVQRWRRSLRVEALSGRISLDARSGAPLAAKLEARWNFRLPAKAEPRTGIPIGLAQGRGRVSLTFELELVAGKVEAITPPAAEAIVDVRRRRLELERQMVEGERPFDPLYRQRWGNTPR